MQQRKIIENFIVLTIAFFVSFSFIYSLSESMLLSDFMGNYRKPLFMIIGLLLAVCIFAFSSKTRLKISAGILGVITGIVLIYLLRNPDSAKAFHMALTGYFDWLRQYIQFADNFVRGNAVKTLLLLSAVITTLVFYFTVIRFNFYVILVSGLAMYVIQWRKGYFVSYSAFYTYMFFIIALYLLHIYYRNQLSGESDLVSISTFFSWVLPVCIIVFALSFQLSINTKPVRIVWLNKTLVSFLKDVNRKISFNIFDYFTLSTAGFGNSNILGGNVRLNDTVVMEVRSPRRIYLKGSSRDVYTGSSWIRSDDTLQQLHVPETPFSIDVMDPNTIVAFSKTAPDNPMVMDYLEVTEGMRLLGVTDANEKFYNIDEIEIQYVNMNTKSLFIPAKLRQLRYTHLQKPIKTYLNSDGIFFSSRKAGKDFRYSITAYTPWFSDEYFKNLLRKSETGLYSRYDRGLKAGVTVDVVKKLDQYARKLNKKYTQLPASLPDRVTKLAFSIAQSYDNNYDKVKAIEGYLVANYPYTLLPNSTPYGRDFVDYFLFDQKQGYCSYYASAMAVMVRSLGIPARYVEGYIMPPKSDGFSKYTITNEQAHAWVEVYFEGYGWLTFEPTAPFNKAFYNKPKSVDARFVKNFEDDPTYRKYINSLREYDKKVESDASRNALAAQIIIITSVIMGILFTIIIVIVLYNLAVRKYRLHSVEKMTPRECIIKLVNYYINILALLGLPVRKGETPSEYSKRVGAVLLYDRYAFKNESMSDFLKRTENIEEFTRQSKFKNVMDAFIQARYNPGEVNEEHKKITVAYYSQLMEKVRANLGITRYLMYKYILGRFNFR